MTYYQNKQDFVKLENEIFVINNEGYLNLTSDEITEIKQLQALNNLEIFTFPSSTSTTTLYKKDYAKRTLFLKRYYKFAFQLIIQKFCKIGFIFTRYNIKNFCINQQKGLMLWEHSDMKFYSNAIKHILRCTKKLSIILKGSSHQVVKHKKANLSALIVGNIILTQS